MCIRDGRGLTGADGRELAFATEVGGGVGGVEGTGQD